MAFGEDVSTPVSSASQKDLLSTDDKSELLTKNKAEIFYSIAHKLLFVAKSTRHDIQLALSF